MEKKKKFKFPHTYILLFCVIILIAVLSYIIPAGQFSRVEDPNTGRMIVDPDSFTYVEQSPVGFFEVFSAIPRGMTEVAEIMTFIFVIGGAFAVINASGAIEASINKAAQKLKNAAFAIIPIFVFIFSFLGSTIGMAEETLVFIPIGVAMARALGYDALVGASMVILGAGGGLTAGFMNPFTLGVAQGIAELPLFSGIKFRIVLFIVITLATAVFLLLYGRRIKADPTKSLIYDVEQAAKNLSTENKETVELTKTHITILVTFFGGLVFLVWAIMNWGWYITEIATFFLILAVICGFEAKMGPSRIAEHFVEGAGGMIFGAVIVGVARGILVVMTDGMILDTIVNFLSNLIAGLPETVSAVVMMLIQVVINFFIPSGSGQAAATMPIMVPIADMIGVTRQTAVLAFQFGDGFTNSVIPTAGILLANLAVAKIPYRKWLRFVAPLMLTWFVIATIFLVIAVKIDFGPF